MTAGAIQVKLERHDSQTSHGYNTIRGKFYYNTTGTGEAAVVTFGGDVYPYQFSSSVNSLTMRIEGVIFALTQYYVKLEGYMETTMTLRIVLPTFLSAYTMTMVPAQMPAATNAYDVGGFISPELSNGTYDLHGTVDVYQRSSTKITSNDGRPASWTGDDLKYTFSLIDKDVRFLLSGIDYRDDDYSYLPTHIYERIDFTDPNGQWASMSSESFYLTTRGSYDLNTGSWTSPAFSGTLLNDVENPELVMTAVARNRPYIFFAMEKGNPKDVTGATVTGAAYCTAPHIVNPAGGDIMYASEIGTLQAETAVRTFT